MLLNLFSNLLRNENLREVEIAAILMPIFFAQSMLSFGQYEIKSSESTRFRGSILMRLESLEPPQFSLHASQFAFKYVEIEDFGTG